MTQLERYTMVLYIWNLQNQYCQYKYNTKEIYRFNAIPIILPKAFFRSRTEYCKICMETQETLNSQNNIEKEKLKWRKLASRL